MLFNQSRIEEVDFTGTVFPDKIYEERLLEKKFHGQLEKDEEEYCPENWQEVSTIYRKLKQAHQRHGDYAKAGEFFYREMECKNKALKEKKLSLDWFKSFVYSFLKYSCGYGEKPERVIFVSLLTVFIAALFFVFNGIVIGEYTAGERIIDYKLTVSLPTVQALKDFGQCLYHSFVTFTTLGYGDIHPMGLSKVAACIESFIGAFFIALFVLVFGRKMMR